MNFIDNDFKTIQIAFYFTQVDRKDTRVYRFLLPKLLTSHTKDYPNKTKMNEKLEALYGVYFKTRVERVGNLNLISIMLTIPDPKIIRDEHLMREAIDLIDSVFQHRDQMSEEIFESEKRMLIEQWLTLKDKKRLYAQTKFYEHFFDKDPYGAPLSGTLKEIRNVELKGLIQYYQHILNHERIDIVVNGHLSAEDRMLIASRLSGYEKPQSYTFVTSFRGPRPLKTIYEPTHMKQAIVRLGYHMPIFRRDALYEAAVIADIIIGGYPESRLFKIIREQDGLCYDISSNYDYYKGVLMISSGVDSQVKDQALEKIQKVIADLVAYGISDLELKFAKFFYEHQLKTSLDQQSILTQRAFIRHLLNYSETFEEKLRRLEEVTVEDVQNVLNTLRLDTIYVLHGGSHD